MLILRPFAEKTSEPPNLQNTSMAPVQPSPTMTEAKYEKLKREKRQLQVLLHNYQNEFIKAHGRKVQYPEDRLPVQREYERYRVRNHRKKKKKNELAKKGFLFFLSDSL
jgi:hypothetical protein